MKNSKIIYHYLSLMLLASMCANEACAQMQRQNGIPRLVVNVTVDQLRSDYMYAFCSLYSQGGFNKLLGEGRVYEQAINNFYPADRASSTATISTGTVPYYNGVVSGSWLDRNTLRPVNSTDDKSLVKTSGREPASARSILTSTLGDELKVYTQGASKVFSVGTERDAAILAAGHAADCAFWLDDNTGRWMTTDYYRLSSAAWIGAFQRLHSLPDNIASKKWVPCSLLTGNISFFMNGGVRNSFTHTFTGDHRFADYKRSALVNTDVTDLALQCVESNAMGNDGITDLLNVQYYAGMYKDGSLSECHMELQDTYLRLDEELNRLISTIEKKVGKDNVIFVLTSTGYSDSDIADYTKMGIPSGTFYINRTANLLNMYLCAIYGQRQYVDVAYHNQIYLNHKLIEQQHLSLTDILTHSRDFLQMSEGIRDVYTADRILSPTNDVIAKVRNDYNTILSGDIIVEVAPGWKVVNEESGETFTSVASSIVFPIIFYGGCVPSGKVSTVVSTDCIAPTICKSIRIRAPNGCRSLPLF